MAKSVGPTGRLFAFDIQQPALDRTAERLAAAGFTNVTLLRRDHAELRVAIPVEHHGRLAAAVFNLGFLPGGDQRIVTRAESTRVAIGAAAELLRAGGVLVVTAYPGHDGGAEETAKVAEVIAGLATAGWRVEETASTPGPQVGPHLWIATKPVVASHCG